MTPSSPSEQILLNQYGIKHEDITEDERTSMDVLCGTGTGPNQWSGNIAYRAIVEERRAEYLAASHKAKRPIAMQVVQVVRTRGGRFLKKNKLTGKWSDIGDGGKSGAIEKAARLLRETTTSTSNSNNNDASTSSRHSGDSGLGQVFRSARNILKAMSGSRSSQSQSSHSQQHNSQRHGMSHDNSIQTGASRGDDHRRSNFSNPSIPMNAINGGGARDSNYSAGARDSNFSMGSFVLNPASRMSDLTFTSNGVHSPMGNVNVYDPQSSNMSMPLPVLNRLSSQSNLTLLTNYLSVNSHAVNTMMSPHVQQQQIHMNNMGPPQALNPSGPSPTAQYVPNSQQIDSSVLRETANIFLPDQEMNVYNQQQRASSSSSNPIHQQPYHNQMQNSRSYSSNRALAQSSNIHLEREQTDFRASFRREMLLSKQNRANSSRSIRDIATLSAKKLGANINWNSVRSIRSDVTWDEPAETLDDEQLNYIVESLQNIGDDMDDLSTSLAGASISGADTKHIQLGRPGSDRGLLRKMSASELSVHTHTHRSSKHRRNLSDESNIYKKILKNQATTTISHGKNNCGTHTRSASDTSLPMYTTGMHTSNGLYDPIPVYNLNGSGDVNNNGSLVTQHVADTSWASDQKGWERISDLTFSSNLPNGPRKSDRVSFGMRADFSQRDSSSSSDFHLQCQNITRGNSLSNMNENNTGADYSSWTTYKKNSLRGGPGVSGSPHVNERILEEQIVPLKYSHPNNFIGNQVAPLSHTDKSQENNAYSQLK